MGLMQLQQVIIVLVSISTHTHSIVYQGIFPRHEHQMEAVHLHNKQPFVIIHKHIQ